MKKLRFLFLLYSIISFGNLRAADTVFVKEAQIPVLLERQDNILFYIRLETDTAQTFNDVVLQFTENTSMQNIQSVKLYYSGTEALQDYGKNVLLLYLICLSLHRERHWQRIHPIPF